MVTVITEQLQKQSLDDLACKVFNINLVRGQCNSRSLVSCHVCLCVRIFPLLLLYLGVRHAIHWEFCKQGSSVVGKQWSRPHCNKWLLVVCIVLLVSSTLKLKKNLSTKYSASCMCALGSSWMQWQLSLQNSPIGKLSVPFYNQVKNFQFCAYVVTCIVNHGITVFYSKLMKLDLSSWKYEGILIYLLLHNFLFSNPSSP